MTKWVKTEKFEQSKCESLQKNRVHKKNTHVKTDQFLSHFEKHLCYNRACPKTGYQQHPVQI